MPHESSIMANAQMNSPNGTAVFRTIIGNISIPFTNSAPITPPANATGTNITGPQKSLLAQNVTSANAFTKEDTTTPVSPSGTSTQAERAPPSNRLVNNTVSTTNAINTNVTRGSQS